MYVSKCPVDRPDGAFYLKPLAKPTQTCWYQKTPVGHNTLQKTVSRLCDSAGFDGHLQIIPFVRQVQPGFLRLKWMNSLLCKELVMHQVL